MYNSTDVAFTAWSTDFTWRATEFVFKEITVRWWYLSLQRWLPWRTESHRRPKRHRHLRPLEGEKRTNVRNKQRLWMMNRTYKPPHVLFSFTDYRKNVSFCTSDFQKHKPTIFIQQAGRFFLFKISLCAWWESGSEPNWELISVRMVQTTTNHLQRSWQKYSKQGWIAWGSKVERRRYFYLTNVESC